MGSVPVSRVRKNGPQRTYGIKLLWPILMR
ncbi:hypothetical protein SAMN05444166_6496 [Singulisphaera sp. GP187]|nr:hypothetical protein SAMN05444166_6496 [Singulisphaera sp. GP187]